jgi:hypothetical protein
MHVQTLYPKVSQKFLGTLTHSPLATIIPNMAVYPSSVGQVGTEARLCEPGREMEQTEIRPYHLTFWNPASRSSARYRRDTRSTATSWQQTHQQGAAVWYGQKSVHRFRRSPKPRTMLARTSSKLLLCSGSRQFDTNSENEKPVPLVSRCSLSHYRYQKDK